MGGMLSPIYVLTGFLMASSILFLLYRLQIELKMGADATTSSRWGFPFVFGASIQLLLTLCFLAGPVGCWRPSTNPPGPTGTNIPNPGWMHRMRLDANYDVYWSISDSEVTFEVQVRTLGYLVFGLSPSGHFHDADLIVGWIHNGRPRFQVNVITFPPLPRWNFHLDGFIALKREKSNSPWNQWANE